MKAIPIATMLLFATACTTPLAPTDASVDAALDASVDAALDASVDAACTTRPGDLPGDRVIAAGALLPNMTFSTATGGVSLVDYHVPCAPRAELIVIRSLAAWSGHSLWHVAHTARLLAHPQRARLHFVDVLVAGIDALPARVADLAPFAAHYDQRVDALGIDPQERFAPIAIAGIRLPQVVIVDARDLRVVRVLRVPHAGEIEHAIDGALASLDGLAPPAPYTPPLTDTRFSEDEWALIEGMAYGATTTTDPSNVHADDAAAAALGRTLFDDVALSPAAVGCRTCHQSAMGFGDARPVGHGVSDVTRNTPTLYAAAFVRWPFWDGRVDSLWAQALGPAESAREMGSSRLFIAHAIASMHRSAYESVFGAMPDLSDALRFPANGGPGVAAWDAMASADQTLVNRVFTNMGKAIEAYERTLSPPHTRFDDYVAGTASALSAAERDGLHEYLLEGCADCHYGPAMSNGAFHAIGMPGFGTGAMLDVGRASALTPLTSSLFRRQGAYSDDRSEPDPLAGITTLDAATTGAFRTPTLRGLSATGPYGHAGTFATLHDVVVHYATIRMPTATPDPHVAGTIDAHLVGFDNVPARIDAITAFLNTL